MDSPSSISSYSSSSLSSSFSTSPVNSDSGFPSDNDREGKSTQGLRPDAAGQRGGSQPSPGPIRCRHRPRISSNQHTASHLEQRGSRVKRSRDGELETRLHTGGCTTEGDLLFAQKCKELQGFIRPLTDLLNGLKMGRFDKGLSSFQQSVAMDRIQRIVGVLQKPQMGERYLGTLLQVEGMLKTWFPHVAAQKSSLGGSRHQISKHFPRHQSDSAASSPAPLMEKLGQTQLGPFLLKPAQPWHPTEWPAMNLTWTHSTPICNPPLSSQGSASSHSSSGSGASIGVILVLQKGGQPFTHSAPGTPIPPATLSPVTPGELKKPSGDGEGPCCHSLPATVPSDCSCTLCPPVLPTTVGEMTAGPRDPQMSSHPAAAPALSPNPGSATVL
ncbi:circadian-associated transcriptional repressor [Peromyscus californicus insignis]|uniref:circadian-associated transcriptional repressor n=1 Tax=Peromyscus californicus insignis TaxID=564181 RepID=UPI0022A77355|nr:circadian-associated transcriptional repressor [Peromyscus californicus insignis]